MRDFQLVKLEGKCLCGEVSYEYQGEVGVVVNCHCQGCRTWHAAAYRTRTTGLLKHFAWITGENRVNQYDEQTNSIKHFCKVCGSSLISTYKDNAEVVGLPISGLEGAADLKPQCHIFVKNKAAWHVITDDLPQYQSWPDNPEDILNLPD